MKYLRIFALSAVLFSSLPAAAADNYPLEKCGTREEAVDFATKCLLAGGTSSTCSNGKMKCCRTFSDGTVCVLHPENLPTEKVKPKQPPANQQPGQVTPKP